MAFAFISPDSTFTTRMSADTIRPADFLYLNWPTGVIRATTHHESVTDADSPANTWDGVGRFGFIRPAAAEMSGAAQRWEVGLTGLPRDDSSNEVDAIGVEAEIYLGVADADFGDWRLDLIFAGYVQSAGKFEWTKNDNGQLLLTVSLVIGDQRNPRHGLVSYHSMRESGDYWRHLHSVERKWVWPE